MRLLRFPLQRLLQLSISTSNASYLALTPELVDELEQQRAIDDGSEESSELKVRVVRAVLDAKTWNVTQAAEELGMTRHQLHRFVKKHGIGRG